MAHQWERAAFQTKCQRSGARLVGLCLAATMLVGLAACGFPAPAQGTGTPAAATQETGTPATEDQPEITGIFAGYWSSYVSFMIASDGNLWAWGRYDYGLLGDETKNSRPAPVKMMESVQSVSSGQNHSLALKKDGSLWAWGKNEMGQLGNGTYDDSPTPIKIMDGVKSITTGRDHSMAVKEDGGLWVWGSNGFGKLGDGGTVGTGAGTHEKRSSPIKVMEDVIAVAAGDEFSMAVKEDGSLWIWGAGRFGELGDGSAEYKGPTYLPNKVMDDVRQIAAGTFNCMAVKEDGSLWIWGNNQYGQLCDGTTNHNGTPRKVMDAIQSIVAGTFHMMALKEDGSLWTWGLNQKGALGNGTTNDSPLPIQVMDGVKVIAAGPAHSMALKQDGSLWAWGASGGLGLSGQAPGYTALPVEMTVDMKDEAAARFSLDGNAASVSPSVAPSVSPYLPALPRVYSGYRSRSSYLVQSDGSLWVWGRNAVGQLGVGMSEKTIVAPQKVLEGVKDIAAGPDRTLALKEDNALWINRSDGSWNENVMDHVQAATLGFNHSLVLKDDGSLWAWGDNEYGQLGDGTTVNKETPAKVMEGVIAVAAGELFTLALKEDGSLWTWGRNDWGQLGNGDATRSSGLTPIKVMDSVQAIAAGLEYAMALKNDGSLWAWGSNFSGQLGNGTRESSPLPLKVMDGVKALAAGSRHALALKQDDSLWAWGTTIYDRGGSPYAYITTPEKVMDDVRVVAAGAEHTLALCIDGSLWAWGDNSESQLGNNTTPRSRKPAKVMEDVNAESTK